MTIRIFALTLFLALLHVAQAGVVKDSTYWYVSGAPGVKVGFPGEFATTKVNEPDQNKKTIIYGKGLPYNYSLTIIQPKAEQKLYEKTAEHFKHEIAYQVEFYEKENSAPFQPEMKAFKFSEAVSGFSTHFDLNGYRYFYRVVVLENTMYMLAVTTPIADKDDPSINKFMSSFATVPPIDPEE